MIAEDLLTKVLPFYNWIIAAVMIVTTVSGNNARTTFPLSPGSVRLHHANDRSFGRPSLLAGGCVGFVHARRTNVGMGRLFNALRP